jgi:hypothetical protein
VLQLAILALYLGDNTVAKSVADAAGVKVILRQIYPDGSLPQVRFQTP